MEYSARRLSFLAPMEYSARRDKDNPHWVSLLKHVRELNDKLMEVVNHYLGNQVMARITDDNLLPKATSNIADACLEVTDATCLVMATMRSIIKQYKVDANHDSRDAKIRRLDDKIVSDKNCPTSDITINDTKCSPSIMIRREEINAILSYIEVALLMSRNNKNTQLECLLDQATSLLKKIIDQRKNST